MVHDNQWRWAVCCRLYRKSMYRALKRREQGRLCQYYDHLYGDLYDPISPVSLQGILINNFAWLAFNRRLDIDSYVTNFPPAMRVYIKYYYHCIDDCAFRGCRVNIF